MKLLLEYCHKWLRRLQLENWSNLVCGTISVQINVYNTKQNNVQTTQIQHKLLILKIITHQVKLW
jgi:hypothetical protein